MKNKPISLTDNGKVKESREIVKELKKKKRHQFEKGNLEKEKKSSEKDKESSAITITGHLTEM